jgi:hypothetical protein
MRNDQAISEIREFVRWALYYGDIELLDDAKRFLQQLYVFAKMRYGGSEYAHQQEQLQIVTERLLRRADAIDSYKAPISLKILGTVRRADKMILNMARENAVVACELMGFEPIPDCPEPCYCSPSSPPSE